MSVRPLAAAVARHEWIKLKRYPFETFMQLVVIYVLFALMFFGARALISSPGTAEQALPAIVVGFLTWTVAITAYSEIATDVTEEATAGTLEQLAMSPFGLPVVLSVRFVASISVAFLFWAILLVAMMATSGRWLALDPLSTIPLLFIIAVGVLGVGFMVGGAALVFKRVQALLQLMQFGFIALVAVPLTTAPWLKFLPLTWGNELAQRVMIDRTSLWHLPAGDLLFLVANALAWYAAGIAVFRRMEVLARDRGLLGHY